MVDVHILIPTEDNNKVPFPPSLDLQFRLELDRLFGGSSLLSGVIAGRWVSGGQTYTDENRVFAVFVNGMLADGPKIMEAVNIAKALYSQLAITVRYLNQAEIL